MSEKLINDKVKEYLSELLNTNAYLDVHDVLIHSEIYFEESENPYTGKITKRLHFIINPIIYKKYHDTINNLAKTIKDKFTQITHVNIDETRTYPDLNKYQLVQNKLVTTPTPWESINLAQENLIKDLKMAKESVDFQNIGNSSRTLLQNFAEIVFDPEKHKSNVEGIALDKGKFKNRLHTYIKSELAGEKKSTVRGLAESLVTTAEKSIDLSNELTHDLSADSFNAEICVISTLAVVNIVSLIHNHSI